MPEINLGIGCEVGTHEGCTREWLYWYNQKGDRFLAPANVIEQERQRVQQAEQRAELAEQQLEQERRLREELLNKLRERGINLDEL
jgi:hypothetical protein